MTTGVVGPEFKTEVEVGVEAEPRVGRETSVLGKAVVVAGGRSEGSPEEDLKRVEFKTEDIISLREVEAISCPIAFAVEAKVGGKLLIEEMIIAELKC